MEGSRCEIIYILSKYLPGQTEENHNKSLLGTAVSRLRFEASTLVCLVILFLCHGMTHLFTVIVPVLY
jgi:hypothetical protein